MIPWSIGLLALFYGIAAAVSAASAWRAVIGASPQALVWPMIWLGVSVSAMLGLVLMRPWARVVAVWGFTGLIAMTLSLAAALVTTGRPGLALLTTLGAGLYVLAIRYLRRPTVKAWFQAGVTTE